MHSWNSQLPTCSDWIHGRISTQAMQYYWQCCIWNGFAKKDSQIIEVEYDIVEYDIIFHVGLDHVSNPSFLFCWRRSVSESADNPGCRKLGCAPRPWEVFTVQRLLCQQQGQLHTTFLPEIRRKIAKKADIEVPFLLLKASFPGFRKPIFCFSSDRENNFDTL